MKYVEEKDFLWRKNNPPLRKQVAKTVGVFNNV